MKTISPQSMSDKIIIVDFEDSFTYNIANVLFPFEKNCRVVSHQDFFQSIESFTLADSKKAIILGPGPGHPDQYEIYFSKILKLMNNESIYLMGICLGHQLMARAQKREVSSSASQMHGQAVAILFQNKSYLVQRYNSLAVKIDGVEVNICEYKNGISYQFHPESVGTHENVVFFKSLLNFIQS